jgi:hypothetical protein
MLEREAPMDSNKDVNSSSASSRKRSLVDWVQRQAVPRLGRSKHTIYCIQGLDAVLYGPKAAADAVTLCGLRPPRYLWYMLSGSTCDVIQFGVDLLLHYGLNLQNASVCWFLGFFVSVAFRHTFHRYLVFGKC